MLDRAESLALKPAALASAPLPAWARPGRTPETEAETAFLAGAALARLDAIVRDNPPWSGVWRNRLALQAAAASVARLGRAEDAAALRDVFHLTRPGADLGPAGRSLLAWRALTTASPARWRVQVERAAKVLDVPSETLKSAVEAAAACADGDWPAPFAAARCHERAQQALTPHGGAGELLSAWLADSVLAVRLKWPFASLSMADAVVLMGVAYFQPITRGELSQLLGREVSRNVIAALHGEGLVAAGPRSPTPGAPYAYVTTSTFLSRFGFESLRDLPDIEKLEDAGLLGRAGEGAVGADALAAELSSVLGLSIDEPEPSEDAA